VLPPYLIREVDGVKIGIIGSPPTAVPQVLVGRAYQRACHQGDAELKELVPLPARAEQVGPVVMISSSASSKTT